MSTRQSLGRHDAGPARPARSRHAAPRTGRKRTALVVGGTLAFTGVGTATAAWVAMGSGAANGQAISAKDLQITSGTASPDLYPGAKGSVTVTVTNTNPFPVKIDKAAFRNLGVTPLNPVGTGGVCTSGTDVKLGAAVNLTPVALAAASDSSTDDTKTITIPDAVEMVLGAVDGCQGDSFTLMVDLSGTAAA